MTDGLHRRFVRLFFSLTLAAACLMRCSPAYAQNPTLQDQITQHEQKLAEASDAKNQKEEASELHSLGVLHWRAGEMQRALECDNQSLAISHSLGDRKGESTTLSNIGLVYSNLGQKQKALDYYTQALSLERAAEDHSDEAATLNGIATVYSDLGQEQKALD